MPEEHKTTFIIVGWKDGDRPRRDVEPFAVDHLPGQNDIGEYPIYKIVGPGDDYYHCSRCAIGGFVIDNRAAPGA